MIFISYTNFKISVLSIFKGFIVNNIFDFYIHKEYFKISCFDISVITDILDHLLSTQLKLLFILFILGVRQEQDIYVRLIDSVTKQVNIS